MELLLLLRFLHSGGVVTSLGSRSHHHSWLLLRACTTQSIDIIIITTTTAGSTELGKRASSPHAGLIFAPACVFFVCDRLGDLCAELVDQRALGVVGEQRRIAGLKRAGVERRIEKAEYQPTGHALGGVQREGVCARLAKAGAMWDRFGRWMLDVRDKLLKGGHCGGYDRRMPLLLLFRAITSSFLGPGLCEVCAVPLARPLSLRWWRGRGHLGRVTVEGTKAAAIVAMSVAVVTSQQRGMCGSGPTWTWAGPTNC